MTGHTTPQGGAQQTTIDVDSPIETRNGRQVFSELTDQGYALADKIELWLQARPRNTVHSEQGRARRQLRRARG